MIETPRAASVTLFIPAAKDHHLPSLARTLCCHLVLSHCRGPSHSPEPRTIVLFFVPPCPAETYPHHDRVPPCRLHYSLHSSCRRSPPPITGEDLVLSLGAVTVSRPSHLPKPRTIVLSFVPPRAVETYPQPKPHPCCEFLH